MIETCSGNVFGERMRAINSVVVIVRKRVSTAAACRLPASQMFRRASIVACRPLIANRERMIACLGKTRLRNQAGWSAMKSLGLTDDPHGAIKRREGGGVDRHDDEGTSAVEVVAVVRAPA